MEDDFFNIPLQDVKRELRRGIVECSKRGLLQSAKWLAEMNHGLADIDIDNGEGAGINDFQDVALEGISAKDYDNYFLAKSYFDVREYERAAYFVRNCESSVPKFLHLYATYMGREKQRLDSMTDNSNLNESGHVRDLSELLATLKSDYNQGRLDGYGMYLYGVVLKGLNLNQAATQILLQSIRLTPMLWSAYVELAPLITEKEKLLSVNLGGHWMRQFFIAHTYIELYLNDEGLKQYEELQSIGFKNCIYVTAQMALAYHNKRDVDKAIEIFQGIQEADPFRLDNLDIYSNLLFVKELKTEIAQLAHKAVAINKYRPETCCVIGNYYSFRCDHQKAILYFQRALKLNPKYLAAWTLMGHEFMELKNTNAAIQSYRKAVEVNKRDYRAWYGLGQSYEILKMHYYSLYYFKIAHQLRPYDSRMLVALGETYEKLDKSENALKCYWKACSVGDIEGIAMYKLANLQEKLGNYEDAVHCYMMYCEDERAAADKQSLYHGYMTLANYYESKGEYDQASHYAYKCLESDDRKSEAKSLLKTIENKRTAAVAAMLTKGESTAAVTTTAVAATATTTRTEGGAEFSSTTSVDNEMELCEVSMTGSDIVFMRRDSKPISSSSLQPSATIQQSDVSLNESAMMGVSRNVTTQETEPENESNELNSMEISSISID